MRLLVPFLLTVQGLHAEPAPLWPALASPPDHGAEGRHDAALVVALEGKGTGVPGAEALSEAWVTWLRQGRGVPAARIHTVRGSEATADGIARHAAEAALDADGGGVLWVVILGRGAWSPAGDELRLLGSGAPAGSAGAWPDGVAVPALLDLLRVGSQERSVVVADLCAPPAPPTPLPEVPLPAAPAARAAPEGVSLMVATRDCSVRFPGLEVPPFGYLVLGALHGWADGGQDGSVTAREALGWVAAAAATMAPGAIRTPALDLSGADPVLARGREEPPDLVAILDRWIQIRAEERIRALDEAEDILLRQARTEWSFLSAALDDDPVAARPQVEAFYARYRPAVLTRDHMRRWVRAPEAEAARRWLPERASPDRPRTVLEERHIQLTEDMRQRLRRGVWRGVETAYVELMSLVPEGARPTYEDHMAGAAAARALGNVRDVYDRLLRAVELDPTDDALQWLNELERSYGRVTIRDEGKERATLSPARVPFAPDRRAALDAATAALAAGGTFDGWLPEGRYTFGERSFLVIPGDEPQEIVREKRRNRDGP